MDMHELSPSVMPWSVESETAVLGSLLLSPDRFDMVADILTPEMFHSAFHRSVYGVIASLVNACKAVDVVIVYEALERAGDANTISMAEVNDLAQYTASPSNVRRYAEIIAERALMRGLMAASDKARDIATEAGLTGAERLDQCQNEFQKLANIRVGKDPKSVMELSISMLDRIQDMADGSVVPGIRTRIDRLDKMLGGGVKTGKQVVIAARPSIGKSALAMELAYAVADQGFAAGVLSQEMEAIEWMDRLTCRMGLIEMDHMATGKLTDSEWSVLTDVVERLRNLPLFIDDQAGLTLGEIQAKARKLKREHDIKLLAVDYIQLCAPSNSKLSRHHQLEEISRGLKVLAKQLGITTVILSQLGREADKRNGGRPSLVDLKESGAIEEDADVVILLSVDTVLDNGDVIVHAEIAKNRGGSKGFVKLCFSGRYQRFVETNYEAGNQQSAHRPKSYSSDF